VRAESSPPQTAETAVQVKHTRKLRLEHLQDRLNYEHEELYAARRGSPKIAGHQITHKNVIAV
jgi:hypothetical protein